MLYPTLKLIEAEENIGTQKVESGEGIKSQHVRWSLGVPSCRFQSIENATNCKIIPNTLHLKHTALELHVPVEMKAGRRQASMIDRADRVQKRRD